MTLNGLINLENILICKYNDSQGAKMKSDNISQSDVGFINTMRLHEELAEIEEKERKKQEKIKQHKIELLEEIRDLLKHNCEDNAISMINAGLDNVFDEVIDEDERNKHMLEEIKKAKENKTRKKKSKKLNTNLKLKDLLLVLRDDDIIVRVGDEDPIYVDFQNKQISITNNFAVQIISFESTDALIQECIDKGNIDNSVFVKGMRITEIDECTHEHILKIICCRK